MNSNDIAREIKEKYTKLEIGTGIYRKDNAYLYVQDDHIHLDLPDCSYVCQGETAKHISRQGETPIDIRMFVVMMRLNLTQNMHHQ